MTRAAILSTLLLGGLASAQDAGPRARPTVMVLYFDVNATDPNMAVLRKGLAQMLITDLVADDRLQVVEREHLEDVLKELKLGEGRFFDQATVAKVGRLVGARFIVTGSLQQPPFTQQVRVDARVIDLERAVNVRARSVMLKPEDIFEAEQTLAESLKGMLQDAAALPREPAKAKQTRRPRLKLDTAVRYSRALDAQDRGDKKAAVQGLTEVVKEQPDFVLARLDLLSLTK